MIKRVLCFLIFLSLSLPILYGQESASNAGVDFYNKRRLLEAYGFEGGMFDPKDGRLINISVNLPEIAAIEDDEYMIDTAEEFITAAYLNPETMVLTNMGGRSVEEAMQTIEEEFPRTKEGALKLCAVWYGKLVENSSLTQHYMDAIEKIVKQTPISSIDEARAYYDKKMLEAIGDLGTAYADALKPISSQYKRGRSIVSKETGIPFEYTPWLSNYLKKRYGYSLHEAKDKVDSSGRVFNWVMDPDEIEAIGKPGASYGKETLMRPDMAEEALVEFKEQLLRLPMKGSDIPCEVIIRRLKADGTPGNVLTFVPSSVMMYYDDIIYDGGSLVSLYEGTEQISSVVIPRAKRFKTPGGRDILFMQGSKVYMTNGLAMSGILSPDFNQMIDNVYFEGVIKFYPTGSVEQGTVKNPFTRNNIRFKGGTPITFYENGNIKAAILDDGNTDFYGFTFLEYSQILFNDEGKVIRGKLREGVYEMHEVRLKVNRGVDIGISWNEQDEIRSIRLALNNTEALVADMAASSYIKVSKSDNENAVGYITIAFNKIEERSRGGFGPMETSYESQIGIIADNIERKGIKLQAKPGVAVTSLGRRMEWEEEQSDSYLAQQYQNEFGDAAYGLYDEETGEAIEPEMSEEEFADAQQQDRLYINEYQSSFSGTLSESTTQHGVTFAAGGQVTIDGDGNIVEGVLAENTRMKGPNGEDVVFEAGMLVRFTRFKDAYGEKIFISEGVIAENAKIVVSDGRVVHEYEYLGGNIIQFHLDGSFRGGFLAKNTTIDGVSYRAERFVEFDDNGYFMRGFLAQDTPFKIRGQSKDVLFMGDTEIVFSGENGILVSGMLVKDTEFESYYREGKVTFAKETVVNFHDNGEVASGTLAKETLIQGDLYGEGMVVVFNDDGSINLDGIENSNERLYISGQQ